MSTTSPGSPAFGCDTICRALAAGDFNIARFTGLASKGPFASKTPPSP